MKDDFENVEIDNSDDFAEELTEPSVPSSDFNESGTSGIGESGSSFASETNSDVSNASDADIERLNDSKNKNYNKADSGKDAFERKINNKDYYKNQINDAKERKENAKNNLNKAKDNKDKTKDRLNQARQRRNSIPRGQRTSSDKEEYKNAKSAAKEAKANEKKEKNNLKDAKKDIFNAKKDNLKSKAYQARHPIEAAKNTAEAAVKTAAKKALKKVLIVIAPYVIGFILIFLLAFFVIELILSPIMEAWGNLEEGVTNVADFSEKLTNFYNGFGFQDSKEAFYDELNDLCDKYTCSNNGSGLDAPLLLTTIFYSEERGYDTDYENIADGLDEEGDPEEDLFESIKNSIVEKYYKESTTTTDENGIEYSTGKVYRLRKLAKNQVKSSGSSYSFDEEKYKTYLFDKYFEKMPEYKKLLGNLTDDQKVSKKEELYNDIISNKDLFKDIFLQYVDADSEGYVDSCLGAIDANLVSELQKPVNIPDGTTVSFGENNSFGVTSSGFHGGVDLNSSTAGVSAGTDVFAIANGVVDSVGTSGSSNQSTSSISNYLFIGDSRYVGIKSNLEGLGQNNTVAAVTSSTPAQWESVASNGSGTVLGTRITLPSTANGISVMLGVNNVSQTSNMQNMLNSLHTRYPSAQIYVNSVYHVGTKYRGSVTNAMIDSFNQTMSSWCSSNSWATYVDVTSGLNDSNGYVKTEYMDGAGLHATGNGKTILVNNIKNAIGGSVNDTYGSWVKIKHNIVIGNNEYNFYSVYNNLDSVTLTKGTNVSKGTKIGVIGASSNPGLHFEFHNDQDSAIDPTNLFIKCNKAIVLSGNNNEEKAWNYFLSNGYTKKAAAGVMANIYAESGYVTGNLENDSNTKANITDEEFTSMVDSGKISQKEFSLSSTYGLYNYNENDPDRGLSACTECMYGYGLAQWTWPTYKYDLYEMYKTNGYSSISDIGLQLEFVLVDMDAVTKQRLNSSSSAEDAAEYYLLNYEKPTNMYSKIKERRGYATDIYSRFANSN